MICAHAPELDPRIRWEASAAASRFAVTVLGFAPDDGRVGDRGGADGYSSILLPRGNSGAFRYLWRLRQVVGAPFDILFGALLIALAPALLLTDEAARRIAPAARRALARAAVAAAASARGGAAPLEAKRARLPARLFYVLTSLRQRFSPATAQFWDVIRSMPEAPEIVHCNDLDTLLVGVLTKRTYGCRLVYDAHEFYPHSDPAGRWLDIRFFSLIERLLIREADAVVTVNPLLGEAIGAAYRLVKVHAVANAEPWLEARAAPPASGMESLARGRVKFLFQGRFAPGRGIEEMIEQWAAVDGERAALFLRGPDNMWRHKAIGQAGELGLLGRSVHFLDAVGEGALVSAAAEADVGIIPYRPLIINDRLSCPNKLSQYLHAGLMVISNDLPYVKSVLAEAGAGLFYDAAAPGSLAQAVRRILDDPELLRRAKANARRFAKDRFNWQIEGEKLYALYESPRPAAAPNQGAAAAEAAE